MPRNNPSNEDIRRIIDAYNSDEDFILLGRQLGIKRRTAYNIVKRFRTRQQVGRLPRGGAHNVKMDEEMKTFIRNLIQENPFITIEDMNNRMRQSLPQKPRISSSSISNCIDGMLYTIKKAVDVPEARNNERTKELRHSFSTWITVDAYNEHIVYLDEAGYNLWTRRSRGRAIRGQPAVRRVHGQRGKNISVIIGISNRLGLVHHYVREGGITREDFNGFLTEISRLIGDENAAYLIFDNAKCHYNVPDPSDAHQCKHLPPYSPQLNPCELAFSVFKADIKRRLGVAQEEFANVPPHINLAQYRRERLTELARLSLPTCINPIVCQNWYNHCRRFIPACLAREDLPENI